MSRNLFCIFPMVFLGSMVIGRAQEPEPKKGHLPTIKEIMQESHQCNKAHIRIIRNEMEKSSGDNSDIDWILVERKSSDLILAGKLLALNQPPKGSLSNWDKRTTLYVANAVLLTDAAEKKNKEDVLYHVKKLSQMCVGCHRDHR